MGNICAEERQKPVDTDKEKLKQSVKEMRKALNEVMSVDDHKYKNQKNLTVRDNREEQNDLLGLHNESRNFKSFPRPRLSRKKSGLDKSKAKTGGKTSDSI